jgi:condensin complex subunit 2
MLADTHFCLRDLFTANINIHKLDAAFDIDPLFHKMSKTFDEGGAKGLLLANLGVSYQGDAGGCKIVFDSSLDDNTPEDETKEPEQSDKTKQAEPANVDISTLITKIDAMVATGAGHAARSIQELPLVPQLASLRMQFAELKKEGFVDHQVTSVSIDFCEI